MKSKDYDHLAELLSDLSVETTEKVHKELEKRNVLETFLSIAEDLAEELAGEGDEDLDEDEDDEFDDSEEMIGTEFEQDDDED